jgi:hypothetical protein
MAIGVIAFFAACGSDSDDSTTERVGGYARLTKVGDSARFASVPAPRWPIRWKDAETVLFQTWVGVAAVRLDGRPGGFEARDPSEYSEEDPAQSIEVAEEARYGDWKAWDGGRYLLRGDYDECGPPLVRSPDGRFLACVEIVTQPTEETTDSFATVIRVR